MFDIHVNAVVSQCASTYSDEQIRRWFEDRTAAEYIAHVGRGRIWVATADDRLLGFSECWPGNIDRLFVPDWAAGNGVGSALLMFAIGQARYDSSRRIKIEATCNARSFYEKYGFRKTADSSFRQPSGMEIETVLMELGPFNRAVAADVLPSRPG